MSVSVREWFLRIAVLLGSFFLFLMILEVAIRLIEPREVMRYFFVQSDDILHHKFIPNAKGRYKTTEFDTHYQINSVGLRDREYPLQKPFGAFRVLMLGDSYTEGDGVENDETFSKVFERLLNAQASAKKYEVINAGCGSYSPLLEYLYLKTEGLRLDPDLVVLNFDLSDVFDDIQYSKLARFNENGEPIGVSPETGPIKGSWVRDRIGAMKDFLKENTRLYNFIRLRISRYIEGVRHKGTALGDIRYDKYAIMRENNNTDDRTWTLTHRYILMIRDLLKSRGVRFAVTVYPYGSQVSSREYNSGRKFWGFRPDTVYSIEPQQAIENFCKSEGIPVINACNDFRQAARTRYPLYLDYNGHWTADGHRLFADVLRREMGKQLLLR